MTEGVRLPHLTGYPQTQHPARQIEQEPKCDLIGNRSACLLLHFVGSETGSGAAEGG